MVGSTVVLSGNGYWDLCLFDEVVVKGIVVTPAPTTPQPSPQPTPLPTNPPSNHPSSSPIIPPSSPTDTTSKDPTKSPSNPTADPSKYPSSNPTESPSRMPTIYTNLYSSNMASLSGWNITGDGNIGLSTDVGNNPPGMCHSVLCTSYCQSGVCIGVGINTAITKPGINTVGYTDVKLDFYISQWEVESGAPNELCYAQYSTDGSFIQLYYPPIHLTKAQYLDHLIYPIM